ncbi:hypothetical protein KQI84_01910 [bacterium]|nr:hypothetical protein [bacterium]
MKKALIWPTILFLHAFVCGNLWAQPPLPLPQNPVKDAISNQAEEIVLQMSAEQRNDLLCSVASYPDDVLDAVFCACRYAPLLVKLERHPTDESFNRAASYLYTTYPDLFKTLQQNPLAAQVTGLFAEKHPVETYQIIDQCRRNNNLLPSGLNSSGAAAVPIAQGGLSAQQPIQVESQSLDSASESIDELSESVDEYNETMDDFNSNFEDYNENLSDLNTNIDEVQESADEAEEAVKSGEVESKAEEYASSISSSNGLEAFSSSVSEDGGAASFGVDVDSFGIGGFGYGRDVSLSGSGMAWNSNQLSAKQLQSQMTMGNQRMNVGFGAQQQSFGRMGGLNRGGAGGRGGGSPGGRRIGPP